MLKKGFSFTSYSRAETEVDAPKGFYASLPQALKSEVLVRNRVEDPEVLKERQALVASKSVSELSRVTGPSDIPIPSALSNLMSGRTMSRKSSRAKSREQLNERERSESSRPGSRGPPSEIYATLPRSLTQELHVRSKEGGNEKVLKERKNLVEEKSPGQLGQIHSFSEIPVPRMIENWLSNSDNG